MVGLDAAEAVAGVGGTRLLKRIKCLVIRLRYADAVLVPRGILEAP